MNVTLWTVDRNELVDQNYRFRGKMGKTHSKEVTGRHSNFTFDNTQNNNKDEANDPGKYHTYKNNKNEFPHDEPNKIYVNRRCLDKDAVTYKLECYEKNKMLIFNQVTCPGEKPRDGTEKDVDALKDCFEKLKFEVHVYTDYTRRKIQKKLDKVTSLDLSDYGCLAIVILTHGGEDGKLWTSDKWIYESDIIDDLKALSTPSLITKPKLLIVQACRGSNKSMGVEVFSPQGLKLGSSVQDDRTSVPLVYRIANEADFLLIHSTYPGMEAVRDVHDGTWFIQSLCKFINDSKEEDDILSILTCMQRDVSINYELVTDNIVKKQMPVVTTMLTRKLYFKSLPKTVKDVIENGIPAERVEFIKQCKESSQKLEQSMEKVLHVARTEADIADHIVTKSATTSPRAELRNIPEVRNEAKEWSYKIGMKLETWKKKK